MLGETPMLEGSWYNPKTGDSFTVRDTFFEDSNLVIMTTDGRRMDYNMMSNYVKSDGPIPKQSAAAPVEQAIPAAVLNELSSVDGNQHPINSELLSEEDKLLLQGLGGDHEVQTLHNSHRLDTIAKTAVETVEDEDSMLVRRMLKHVTGPTVTCSIEWNKFPYKQIEMLDLMGVEVEKIVEYLLNDIDLEKIREIVKNNIEEFIVKRLDDNELENVNGVTVMPIAKKTNTIIAKDVNVSGKYVNEPVEKTVPKLKKVLTTSSKKPTTKKK